MRYSDGAIVAAKDIGAREDVQIIVSTPSFPAGKCDMLIRYDNMRIEQYEQQAFERHLLGIEEELAFIEEAITGDKLYEDKQTGKVRPYSSEQLLKRLNGVEYDIRDLESVLAKRKTREPSLDFRHLEFRLRQSENTQFSLWQGSIS
jgi:hypothetical protein